VAYIDSHQFAKTVAEPRMGTVEGSADVENRPRGGLVMRVSNARTKRVPVDGLTKFVDVPRANGVAATDLWYVDRVVSSTR
jgi:hypothetical protein